MEFIGLGKRNVLAKKPSVGTGGWATTIRGHEFCWVRQKSIRDYKIIFRVAKSANFPPFTGHSPFLKRSKDAEDAVHQLVARLP
jgi:hypothetical protein